MCAATAAHSGGLSTPAAGTHASAALAHSLRSHYRSTESVQVAVRVRPFNKREKDRNATCCVRMYGVKTVIIMDDGEEKEFAFDYSYWSHDGFDELDNPPGYNEKSTTTPSEFGCDYASQKFVSARARAA